MVFNLNCIQSNYFLYNIYDVNNNIIPKNMAILNRTFKFFGKIYNPKNPHIPLNINCLGI